MSTQIFILVKTYIKNFALICILSSLFSSQAMAWNLDLSRRQKYIRQQDARMPSSENSAEAEPDIFSQLFPHTPQQEVVIMNTEKGFVPNTLRFRKGGKYTLHIINISEKDKNISFVMDAFGQHHGMFFGKAKSFVIEPKQEGIFSFLSPETAAEGRVVIFQDSPSPEIRTPASN